MNNRLFVAGLPFSTTSEDLKALFVQFGEVVAAKVITDRQTGQSRGFGYVEFASDDEAKNAIEKLNDMDYGGRKLIVSVAKPKEEKRNKFFNSKFHKSSGGFRGARKSFGQRREGGPGNFGRSKASGRPGFRSGSR